VLNTLARSPNLLSHVLLLTTLQTMQVRVFASHPQGIVTVRFKHEDPAQALLTQLVVACAAADCSAPMQVRVFTSHPQGIVTVRFKQEEPAQALFTQPVVACAALDCSVIMQVRVFASHPQGIVTVRFKQAC
jgi:ribosomal protein L35AE/L33A